jgi:hypothetical protein
MLDIVRQVHAAVELLLPAVVAAVAAVAAAFAAVTVAAVAAASLVLSRMSRHRCVRVGMHMLVSLFGSVAELTLYIYTDFDGRCARAGGGVCVAICYDRLFGPMFEPSLVALSLPGPVGGCQNPPWTVGGCCGHCACFDLGRPWRGLFFS